MDRASITITLSLFLVILFGCEPQSGDSQTERGIPALPEDGRTGGNRA